MTALCSRDDGLAANQLNYCFVSITQPDAHKRTALSSSVAGSIHCGLGKRPSERPAKQTQISAHNDQSRAYLDLELQRARRHLLGRTSIVVLDGQPNKPRRARSWQTDKAGCQSGGSIMIAIWPLDR